MKHHVFLVLLFFVLYSAEMLGFDLSLAPGLSVKNAFLYLIFLGMAIETAVMRQRNIEAGAVFFPFAVYVFYAVFLWVIALLILDHPGYSMRASVIALKAGPIDDLIVLLIFFYAVTDVERAMWVLRGIVWIVIAGNIITVIDAFNVPDLGLIHQRADGRVGGPIGDSNPYAYLLVVYTPVIGALYFAESGLRKFAAGVGFLCSILAFILAFSRGAFVGLLIGGLIGAYFLRRLIPAALLLKATLGVVTLSTVAIVIAMFAGYEELFFSRMEQFSGGRQEVSSGRALIWVLLIEKMLENPLTLLTGYGWHAYSAFQKSLQFGYSPHSHYLLLLFNLGVIGLVLWTIAAANILRITRRAVGVAAAAVRPFLVAFVFGFMALLVALLFNDTMVWLYVWPLVALCLRVAVTQLHRNP